MHPVAGKLVALTKADQIIAILWENALYNMCMEY